MDNADLNKLLVAAIVALWGVVVAAVKFGRDTYNDRLKEKNETIDELKDEIREYRRASDRYIETLERALELAGRSAGVAEDVLHAAPRRRSLRD